MPSANSVNRMNGDVMFIIIIIIIIIVEWPNFSRAQASNSHLFINQMNSIGMLTHSGNLVENLCNLCEYN